MLKFMTARLHLVYDRDWRVRVSECVFVCVCVRVCMTLPSHISWPMVSHEPWEQALQDVVTPIRVSTMQVSMRDEAYTVDITFTTAVATVRKGMSNSGVCEIPLSHIGNAKSFRSDVELAGSDPPAQSAG